MVALAAGPSRIMDVLFEELPALKRLGGIEAATRELAAHMRSSEVRIARSSEAVMPQSPDVVHFHGIWSPALASRFIYWRKRGIACVVSPHGMLEPWALSHKWFKKRLAWMLYQRRLLNRASVLHSTSERERAQFRSLGLGSPAAMIPWGVSIPKKQQPMPRGFGRRVALFVGRIYPVKGLPMLVQAWGRVQPAGWKLKIVGPDEAGHRSEVEAEICKAGLHSAVEFTGELAGAAKTAAYNDADLFVLPSYTENFGIAAAEALAAGLPVITTKGTPWSDLESHRCGWWVDIGVEPLAAALREATSRSDEIRIEMGRRGRALVEQKYRWPKIAADMLSVYKWVLGKAQKPACVQLK